MEAFNTELITIRALLNTDFKESVKGKNYYIPPYQRDYAWGYEEAEKLVRDIKDILNQKEGTVYQPYFIGGVVLSEQSMLGLNRSDKSLEVIDGQQRLTTLIIIVACLVHYIKKQERTFQKKSAMRFIIDEIIPLVQTSVLDKKTYEIEQVYKVERSDKLQTTYETVLSKLLNETMLDLNVLDGLINNEYDENLINIVKKIYENIELLEEDELLSFIDQMLKHTYVVVTTTASVETGFLIFEKLNDSGITLEPQDLLKNYIFSSIEDDEYENLTEEWDDFLSIVKLINTTKARMQTREFLEQFLNISGNYLKVDVITKKKEKIFDKFKEVNTSYGDSLELLADLKIIAMEYKKLKRMYIAAFLNTINFKLAYQVFLSFYKKFEKEYEAIQPELLILMLRLGLTYLLIGKSKDLSNLIPIICEKIINKNGSKEEVLKYITNEINELLEKKEKHFHEIIISSNLFRKKPLTETLFKILNYHFEKNALDYNVQLQHIMPQEYEEIKLCDYKKINDENFSNYINLIGNLIIIDKSINSKNIASCYEKQKSFYRTGKMNSIVSLVFDEQQVTNEFTQKYKASLEKFSGWGRDIIIERSQVFAKLLVEIIIFNKFDKSFLNSAIKINNQYYIKRGEHINAKMELLDNGCKVFCGSMCAIKEPHKNYGWHKTRDKLIATNVLKKEEKYYIFTSDYIFNSPSEAASIILAKQSPGPKDWKNEFNIPLRDVL